MFNVVLYYTCQKLKPLCLQCFDTVGWAVERAVKKLSEVQTCIWPNGCHCHSLSLASIKSRLVLPFWYRLTRVVPEKGPLNGCVCVYVRNLSIHIFIMLSVQKKKFASAIPKFLPWVNIWLWDLKCVMCRVKRRGKDWSSLWLFCSVDVMRCWCGYRSSTCASYITVIA